MPEFTEHTVFIFFTGCLFMALLYHFVLAIIQQNRLLFYYSAYLFAATAFLAERVSLDFVYDTATDLQQSFYFNLLDEPIQMLMYFTYLKFVARALGIFSIAKKNYIIFYKTVLWIIALYSAVHLMGIGFHWFEKRTAFAFIFIRILLMSGLIYLMIGVSKYIYGFFFKIIIAGSVIMFTGNLIAFITSVSYKPFLGMYGVMWTCVALILDVACFSAALGYKARRDFIEKQDALKQLLAKEKQLQQKELEKINEIYASREADRTRIARDLHDEIGSTLSSIHIYSSVAEKIMESDIAKTKQILGKININARTVMDNMNDIIWAMKTGDQQGIALSNKIKNIGYELLDASNINCHYDIETAADNANLDVDLRRNILLIVKESLNNIVKYSCATEVKLKINIAGKFLTSSITDNGKGFDLSTVKMGNGLQNIRYRVNECRGNVIINSAKNEGTSITCKFPLTSISGVD